MAYYNPMAKHLVTNKTSMVYTSIVVVAANHIIYNWINHRKH